MTDPISLLISARLRDIGSFSVRRALPVAKRRTVGPFIFFDHMGPVDLPPGADADVRPHPHIGIATVTYLFEGEIVHRDSLGTVQTIRPGDVNWMTAGRGIVHSERADADRRAQGGRVHGLQLWVALPRAHEECDPAFVHYPKALLPTLAHDDATITVIAGRFAGAVSPVEMLSDLFYVHAVLGAGAQLAVDAGLGERALYVVAGAVQIGGRTVNAAEMAVLADGVAVTIAADAPARVMVLGGAPLDGARHIWWNFVSSSRARIEQAKADWAGGRFPPIPGDDEAIPLRAG